LHEIFDPLFFHQSIPPWALIHGLKLFCIWPNIRRKNRQYLNFSKVNDPPETVLAGSLTFLNWFQRGHLLCWNDFCGVIDTAETISAGSLTLLKQFQRGHWPRQSNFSGVIDSAEIYMTPLKFQILVLGP
jgi:hypothetical protein